MFDDRPMFTEFSKLRWSSPGAVSDGAGSIRHGHIGAILFSSIALLPQVSWPLSLNW